MIKYSFFIVFIAAAVMGFSVPSIPARGCPDSQVGAAVGTHALVRLGQVGNKTYYVDNIGNMNWTEARSLCESQGMVLATVQSEAESSFLRNTDTPGLFDSYYWTAARDSQKMSQLGWDVGQWNEPELIEHIDFFIPDNVPNPLSCAVVSNWTGLLVMLLLPCTHTDCSAGTLCQTV